MSYNLFISHSWSYSNSYENLIKMLDSNPYFYYKDYSVPKDSPIHNTNNELELERAIKYQMSYASCVLVLAGVYATYSKWINKEIRLAQSGFSLPKKIIAVQPWGAEKTSLVVKNAANEIVKWQGSSIIKAIRGY